MRRSVFGVALAGLLLISAQPTLAQSSPGQASEGAPSARQLELARQLVDASGMRSTMTDMLHNMMAQLTTAQSQTLSADRQARMDVVRQAGSDAFARLVPKIVDSVETGYARSFTERELSDMLAFYQTPTGRSMVAKTPQFMQGVVTDLTAMMPQMRRDMGQEICAKIACTPAEWTYYFGEAPAKN